jgi:hypothetical protein
MSFLKNLTFTQVMQIAGLAAVSTLVGTGVVAQDVGLPFITGLVGLGITTSQITPIVDPPAVKQAVVDAITQVLPKAP